MMMTEEEAQQAAQEEGNLSSSSSSSGNLSPLDHKLPEGTDGTNLIVNYIPVLMSENELRSMFAGYGNVDKVKIVHDKFTNQSLGYGFVKYDNPESAVQALAALNGHQVQNKRLKVSIAKPPEKEIKSNLYISGLPLDFTQQDLKDLVLQFGSVVEARVLYDLQSRKCRGVGFARLDSQKNALAAIAGLTGTTLDGGTMPLIVKFADTTNDKARKLQKKYGPFAQFQAQAQAQQRAAQFQSRTSFSTNDPYVTAATAAATATVQPYTYSSPPTIQALQGALPPTTFLTQPQSYSPLQSPQQLYQQPGLQAQAPSPIYQTAASPYRHSPPQFATHRTLASTSTSSLEQKETFTGVCLFVYHLPPDASESSLFSLFSNYGQVTNAKIMRDLNTGRNKGFGFVNMGNEQQAQMAINALNGFQMGNKFLKVSFKNDRAQSHLHNGDL